MDVNLEGGREGIEVARWLVCEAPGVFITGYCDPDTVKRSINKFLGLMCCPSRFIAIGSPQPWPQPALLSGVQQAEKDSWQPRTVSSVGVSKSMQASSSSLSDCKQAR